MGLGAVTESKATYLAIAGGFIWNRKADKTDPNYKTQEWVNMDGETKYRTGAQYGDLTGLIESVLFKTHNEYGESINVTVSSGGENYILSISTNNRNSQDMMKALLSIDLNKELYIRPYDFIGQDKKRAQGVTFKQDGQKVNLKLDLPEKFVKEKEFFAPSNRKAMKRFFEDLSDYFVSEVEAKVVPALDSRSKIEQKPTNTPSSNEQQEEEQFEEQEERESPELTKVVKTEVIKKEVVAEVKPTVSSDEHKRPTALRMKRTLKAYCKENYDGAELPELTKEQMIVWYDLSQAEEELPFNENTNEVSKGDLKNEVDNLLGNK